MSCATLYFWFRLQWAWPPARLTLSPLPGNWSSTCRMLTGLLAFSLLLWVPCLKGKEPLSLGSNWKVIGGVCNMVTLIHGGGWSRLHLFVWKVFWHSWVHAGPKGSVGFLKVSALGLCFFLRSFVYTYHSRPSVHSMVLLLKSTLWWYTVVSGEPREMISTL